MDRRESTSFLCKKWALFTFSLIGVVATIVIAALASKIIDNYVDKNYSVGYIYTKQDLDNIKSMAKVIIYVVAAFSVLFQSLGMVGAYKEHYCMTMTYAIMMTLGSLGSIANAVRVPTFWFSTVLYFAICVVAYSFLYDLRQIRRAQFAGHVYVANQAPTTTHIHMPGPSTIYNGPQYGQPQAQQYGQEQYGQQYQPNYSAQQPDSWQQAPPPYQNENKSGIP